MSTTKKKVVKGKAKPTAKKATIAAGTAEDDEAAKYRRSGASGGTAKSTINGRVSAMYHFNKFLETKKMPHFEDLTEDEICSIPLFQEYGTYLSEFARKRRKDELLSWGTAKQFLGAPKEAARLKFDKASMWLNQVWYTKIRCDVEATILRRCIELGVPVEDKSEPIGRDLLILLNDIMLGRGSVEDIEYRAAVNMTFCAVGRAGECGLSTYNLAQYNTVYESFQLEWQEKKTLEFNGKQAISEVFQLWYENKFVNDDRYVGWTGSVSRDKTAVSSTIRFLESKWPDSVRDVLQAAAPARTTPDYIDWNTTFRAATIDAAKAVVTAIKAVCPQKKFHAKISLNAVYLELVNNELLPKK